MPRDVGREVCSTTRYCYDQAIVTDIYYFSGTGNSLFVARQLADRLSNARLVPIVASLDACSDNRDDDNKRAPNGGASALPEPTGGERGVPATSKSDAVGIVFPVHALTIPIVVRKFLRRFRGGGGTPYVFAVATREGTMFRGFPAMDRLLRRHGMRLDAAFILRMWNNESRHANYVVPSKEAIAAIEAELAPRFDDIADCATARREHLVPDTEVTNPLPFGPLKNRLVESIVVGGIRLAEHIGGVQYFYADASCTRCGICEKVCLSGKITSVDKAPVWRRDVLCYMCFACLNFCPAKAVQIKDIPGVKSFTKTNGRYPHPYATVKDIATQKKLP